MEKETYTQSTNDGRKTKYHPLSIIYKKRTYNTAAMDSMGRDQKPPARHLTCNGIKIPLRYLNFTEYSNKIQNLCHRGDKPGKHIQQIQ